jgi:hypothetical protein
LGNLGSVTADVAMLNSYIYGCEKCRTCEKQFGRKVGPEVLISTRFG